jgi:carbon-monoxide dehydrogenase small subunit
MSRSEDVDAAWCAAGLSSRLASANTLTEPPSRHTLMQHREFGRYAMPQVSLTVNGTPHTVEVEGRTLLVELLREKLGLTGTHVGCDTSQCGACVVHVDGDSVKSCTMLALQAEGAEVTTIEGLAAADGTLHPMQEMFREHHALQCGFCTPGMVMSAIDLVNMHPQGMTEDEIRHGLEGNLCRCTGYHNIVKAIDAAQKLMHPMAQAAE